MITKQNNKLLTTCNVAHIIHYLNLTFINTIAIL